MLPCAAHLNWKNQLIPACGLYKQSIGETQPMTNGDKGCLQKLTRNQNVNRTKVRFSLWRIIFCCSKNCCRDSKCCCCCFCCCWCCRCCCKCRPTTIRNLSLSTTFFFIREKKKNLELEPELGFYFCPRPDRLRNMVHKMAIFLDCCKFQKTSESFGWGKLGGANKPSSNPIQCEIRGKAKIRRRFH